MDIRTLQKQLKAHKINIPATEEAMVKRLQSEFLELEEAIIAQKPHFSGPGDAIKDTIEEEIYDVFYFLLQLANLYDVDFSEVCQAKYHLNSKKYND
ncbi:MAG: MazG nucleotide pyrophosphohydrolase domain-containing protein [Culicoidibacterales bacterium]